MNQPQSTTTPTPTAIPIATTHTIPQPTPTTPHPTIPQPTPTLPQPTIPQPTTHQPTTPQPTISTSTSALLDRILVPVFFHQTDLKHIITLVVEMIQRLVAHNDSIPLLDTQLTRFHSRAAPR